MEQVCKDGIEDNLDPGCVDVFQKALAHSYEIMKLSMTEIQGHIAKGKWGYHPLKGDPESGVPPCTPFEDLPDDCRCPWCGASKEQSVPENEEQSDARGGSS